MEEELVNTLKLLHHQIAQHLEAYYLATRENADEFITKGIRSQIHFIREEIERLERILLKD